MCVFRSSAGLAEQCCHRRSAGRGADEPDTHGREECGHRPRARTSAETDLRSVTGGVLVLAHVLPSDIRNRRRKNGIENRRFGESVLHRLLHEERNEVSDPARDTSAVDAVHRVRCRPRERGDSERCDVRSPVGPDASRRRRLSFDRRPRVGYSSRLEVVSESGRRRRMDVVRRWIVEHETGHGNSRERSFPVCRNFGPCPD